MYGQRIFTRNNFCMFFSIWQDIAGRGGVGGGYRCGRDDFVCLHPLSISPVLQVWTRNYFFFSIWLPLKKGAKCSIGAHCVLGLTRPMVGWTAPLLVPPRPSLVKLQVKMFPTWGNVTPPHWCVTPPLGNVTPFWLVTPMDITPTPSDLSPSHGSPWMSPPLTWIYRKTSPPLAVHGNGGIEVPWPLWPKLWFMFRFAFTTHVRLIFSRMTFITHAISTGTQNFTLVFFSSLHNPKTSLSANLFHFQHLGEVL